MSDIHSRIRSVRDERGLTREAFGTAIGATAAKVQALENGRQRVDHETMEALTRNMGIDANWLLLGEDNHHTLAPPAQNTVSDFDLIPRHQVAASAGHGATVADEAVSGHYAFNRKWLTRRNLNPKTLAVISVRGDSMEPRLRDGDLIVLDKSQTEIADGRAFVLRLGTDLVVKYIQRLGASRISLLSANTFYPPREIDLDKIDGEAEIIGRVVASMQEW